MPVSVSPAIRVRFCFVLEYICASDNFVEPLVTYLITCIFVFSTFNTYIFPCIILNIVYYF